MLGGVAYVFFVVYDVEVFIDHGRVYVFHVFLLIFVGCLM